jgi:hypothetical protein
MASCLLVCGRLGLDQGCHGVRPGLAGPAQSVGPGKEKQAGEKERSVRLGGPVGPEGKGKKWAELENGVFQFLFF